jgi:putative transposase
MADGRRDRLIERLRRLPDEKLHAAEELLAALECGDESPHLRGPRSGDESPHSKDWPHAPVHQLGDRGTYIVTAGTLHKEHHFRGPDALDLLEAALLRLAKEPGWQLEAWAIFSNHYHFVARAETAARDLRAFVKQLHGQTARDLNRMQHTVGRTVWHNFWETELTFEKSYLARLNYVHRTPSSTGLCVWPTSTGGAPPPGSNGTRPVPRSRQSTASRPTEFDCMTTSYPSRQVRRILLTESGAASFERGD